MASTIESQGCPVGWRREIVVRKVGSSAGKKDLYFYAPDGKKLRSKNEVSSYIADNSLDADIQLFDFNKNVGGADDPTPCSTPIVKNSAAGKKVAASAKKTLAPKSAATPKNTKTAAASAAKSTTTSTAGRKKKSVSAKRSVEPAKRFKVRMKFPTHRKRTRVQSEGESEEGGGEDVKQGEAEDEQASHVASDSADADEIPLAKKAKKPDVEEDSKAAEVPVLGTRKRKHTLKTRPESPSPPASLKKKQPPQKQKKKGTMKSPAKKPTTATSKTALSATGNKKKRGRPSSKSSALDHSSNELTASERQLNEDIASIDADILAMKETPPMPPPEQKKKNAAKVIGDVIEPVPNDDDVSKLTNEQQMLAKEATEQTDSVVQEKKSEVVERELQGAQVHVESTSSPVKNVAGDAVPLVQNVPSLQVDDKTVDRIFSEETQKVLDEIVSTAADDVSITTPVDIAAAGAGNRRHRKKPSWLSDAQYETGDPLAKIKESARPTPPTSKVTARTSSPTKMPTYNDMSLVDLHCRIASHTSPTKAVGKPAKTPKIPKTSKHKASPADMISPLGMSPVKRGRGRPRKSVLPTVLSSVNDRIDSEYSNINNFKPSLIPPMTLMTEDSYQPEVVQAMPSATGEHFAIQLDHSYTFTIECDRLELPPVENNVTVPAAATDVSIKQSPRSIKALASVVSEHNSTGCARVLPANNSSFRTNRTYESYSL